jgi:hypothetical protein
MLINGIASDTVLDQAYAWLCHWRKSAHVAGFNLVMNTEKLSRPVTFCDFDKNGLANVAGHARAAFTDAERFQNCGARCSTANWEERRKVPNVNAQTSVFH